MPLYNDVPYPSTPLHIPHSSPPTALQWQQGPRFLSTLFTAYISSLMGTYVLKRALLVTQRPGVNLIKLLQVQFTRLASVFGQHLFPSAKLTLTDK